MKFLTPDLEFGYIKYCYLQLLHYNLIFRNILLHINLHYKDILEII